ncbi:hypothetical protein [Streptomyces sp. CC53]|uniref:hypothetical protein n=1 Tax=Streptomyces sp. C8S0 TaxID=2585716 RepID=UPI0009A0A525
MTPPLTPSHQPSSENVPHDVPDHPHRPQQPAPGGPTGWPPRHPVPPYPSVYGEAEPTAPDVAGEVRRGALVLLAVAVPGILLGLLWLWLAPRIPLVSDGSAVLLKETEGEGAVGADGTFVLLAVAFGAVSAAVVYLLRREGGVSVVVGLALGGLLGSVLGWGTGTLLGPTHDVVAHAKEVGEGVTFDAPLELRAFGALLVWPVAAMFVHLALTALFAPREPEAVWEPGLPAPPQAPPRYEPPQGGPGA